MTQKPDVHDTELDAVEKFPNVQHRVTDVSQHAIERNHVAAPSNSMEENYTGPFPQTNLVAGLGKGVSRIFAPLVFLTEYVALIGRRRAASRA